jgi:hypothetical protein
MLCGERRGAGKGLLTTDNTDGTDGTDVLRLRLNHESHE